MDAQVVFDSRVSYATCVKFLFLIFPALVHGDLLSGEAKKNEPKAESPSFPLNLSGRTKTDLPAPPPNGTPLKKLPERPPLITKWMGENVPMLYKSGPGLHLTADYFQSRMPSALKLVVNNPGQVLIMASITEGIFFTVCDPPIIGEINHVSLHHTEMCDASGMRRDFPMLKVNLKEMWIFQDNQSANVQPLGWVMAEFSAAGPQPAEKKDAASFTQEPDLPFSSINLAPPPGLPIWEPVRCIRRIPPATRDGRDGEVWLMPEGPVSYLAKDDGTVLKLKWLDEDRMLDVTRCGETRWVGMAHTGLWRISGTTAERFVGSGVNLGRTVWRVIAAEDGSLAVLTERGAFWWPGVKKDDPPNAPLSPLYQLAGVCEGVTDILHLPNLVLGFCLDGRVIRWSKAEKTRDHFMLNWPEAGHFSTPRFVVTASGALPDGTVVLGTNHGLYRVPPFGSLAPEKIHSASTCITQIENDGQGGLLAATRDARCFVIGKDQTRAKELRCEFAKPTPKPLNALAATYVGSALLVGTEEGGVLASAGAPGWTSDTQNNLSLQFKAEPIVLDVESALTKDGAPPSPLPDFFGADGEINRAGAFFLGLDRTTRGAWNLTFPASLKPYGDGRLAIWATVPNRSGPEYGILAALPNGRPGPICRPTDRVRLWKDWQRRGMPDWVYHPTNDADVVYLDDHGEAYPGGYDGPGIRFSFPVSPGMVGVLSVGCIAFSGMHSYPVSVRALNKEEADSLTKDSFVSEIRQVDAKHLAVAYIPTANGLTHARFLLANPEKDVVMFECYVDRCHSQNVRLAFVGFHDIRLLPATKLFSGAGNYISRNNASGWGKALRNIFSDSRAAIWSERAGKSLADLVEGKESAAAELAECLLFAGLTLDTRTAETAAKIMSDPKVLTSKSIPRNALYRLVSQLANVPRPTKAALAGAEAVLDELFRAWRAQPRSCPIPELFLEAPLIGSVFMEGILARSATKNNVKPEEILNWFKAIFAPYAESLKELEPTRLEEFQRSAEEKTRLLTAYVLHLGGEYAAEFEMLFAEIKNGKWSSRINAEIEQSRRVTADKSESLENRQKRVNAKIEELNKRHDELLIHAGKAARAAAVKNQMPQSRFLQELNTLWRTARLAETKETLTGLGANQAPTKTSPPVPTKTGKK